MQNTNKSSGNGPGDKTGNAKHSNDFSNEMTSGTIGAEGGNDNGASTLRYMRKKHANDTPGKKNPA